MADSIATTATTSTTNQPLHPLPPINMSGASVVDTLPTSNPDEAVTVMVSYIVSLLKAGNGIYLQQQPSNSPNDNNTSSSSSSVNGGYCMHSTYMNQLEGAPPTAFMPIGDMKATTSTLPPQQQQQQLRRANDPQLVERQSAGHVDPFAAPTLTTPAPNKAPSEDSFYYNPATSVFPKKAHVDRAAVWGLLENGSSASPLGDYASPTPPQPQQPDPTTTVQSNQHQSKVVDFTLDPAHAHGGLFPNGPGLLWTLELITTERAVSMLNDSEWSTISKDDVMLGNALQSEIDFMNHKMTIIKDEDTSTTLAVPSSDKQAQQQQQLLHNSSSSATFASSTTPGGQTNVTEGGQRSSDVSPFYDDYTNSHNGAVLVGSSFDGGALNQVSKSTLGGGMGMRHGSSSLTDMPLPPQQPQGGVQTSATPQRIDSHDHHIASAGSLEVEALTINHQGTTSNGGGGSTSPPRDGSQPTEHKHDTTAPPPSVSTSTTPATASSLLRSRIQRCGWSSEAILEPTPYDIKCIDIFEDLVRSLYAERIHNPNPDIQRVCASAVVGSAVLLFLRYVHLMGGDCAAEYHRFCCENIITPEQLSEAGGESRVLLPNSNVTWQPACWVPPSIVMLRQRRFDMSASLRAALQVVRVFHDGYRIQTSGSQIHLGQYRLHLLRTLNYDVTVIPPHAYIDGLCCTHAASFVLNDMGKTGCIDHGVVVSSPGNFLRSVRTNIDTAIQHTSLVTSCRHVSWIAAAAIAEALLWFTTVVTYFEDVTVEYGLDGDAVMEAAMVQYNLNKVNLFQSLYVECGPAAAFYVKKAVDTMYILRTRTN